MIIDIRVRANAASNRVGGTAGEPPRLIVAVQAPAVDGKANASISKVVAEAFGLRAREVTIISGELNRDKRIELIGDKSELESKYQVLISDVKGNK